MVKVPTADCPVNHLALFVDQHRCWQAFNTVQLGYAAVTIE
jgi:hypothetical protein